LRAQVFTPELHVGRDNFNRALPPFKPEKVSNRLTISTAGRIQHRLIDEGRGRAWVKLSLRDRSPSNDFRRAAHASLDLQLRLDQRSRTLPDGH
jgi:hypothetical protein